MDPPAIDFGRQTAKRPLRCDCWLACRRRGNLRCSILLQSYCLGQGAYHNSSSTVVPDSQVPSRTFLPRSCVLHISGGVLAATRAVHPCTAAGIAHIGNGT